eukprot:748917-Hanusia_phi.AAC.1
MFEKLEALIAEVDAEIARVSQQLTEEESHITDKDMGIRKYWQKTAVQLRKKEEQLRREKEQLRKEEELRRERLLVLKKTVLHRAIDWRKVEAVPGWVRFCKEDKLFRLDRSYLEDADGRPRKVRLYCGDDFKRQQHFPREEMLGNGALGWILGPPGTGKTLTALAFCFSLDMREWSLTLVRIRPDMNMISIQLVDRKVNKCNIEGATTMEQMLSEWSYKRNKLLILDGICRRLAVLTSMASRGKSYPETRWR